MPNLPASDAPVGRAFEALRNGWFALLIAFQGMDALHGNLVDDLGYDPVRSAIDDLWAGIAAAWQAVKAISVVQFFALGTIFIFSNVALGWFQGLPLKPEFVADGTPEDQKRVPRTVFVFNGLGFVVAGVAVIAAWEAGEVWAAFCIALASFYIIRFPVFASLPYWFLHTIWGIEPEDARRLRRNLLAQGFALISGLRGEREPAPEQGAKRKPEDPKPNEPPRGPKENPFWAGGGSAGKPGGSDNPKKPKEKKRPGPSKPTPPANVQGRYTEACRSLGLDPNSKFSKDELIAQWRERMRSIKGNAQIQRQINEDYEFLMKYHNWQR